MMNRRDIDLTAINADDELLRSVAERRITLATGDPAAVLLRNLNDVLDQIPVPAYAPGVIPLRKKRRGRLATVALTAAAVVAIGSAGTAAAAAAGAAPSSPLHGIHTFVFGPAPTLAEQIRGHLERANTALDQASASADPSADPYFANATQELAEVPPLVAQMKDPISATAFVVEFVTLQARVDAIRAHATPVEPAATTDAGEPSHAPAASATAQPSPPMKVAQQASPPSSVAAKPGPATSASASSNAQEPPVSIIDQISGGTANIDKGASDTNDQTGRNGGKAEPTDQRGNDRGKDNGKDKPKPGKSHGPHSNRGNAPGGKPGNTQPGNTKPNKGNSGKPNSSRGGKNNNDRPGSKSNAGKHNIKPGTLGTQGNPNGGHIGKAPGSKNSGKSGNSHQADSGKPKVGNGHDHR